MRKNHLMGRNQLLRRRAGKGLLASLTLAAAVLLLVLPNTVTATYLPHEDNWVELQQKAQTGGTFTLTEDLFTDEVYPFGGSTATGLRIEENLTIDLNGWELKIEIQDTPVHDFNGITIDSGATLTITDSSPTKTGKLTVINHATSMPFDCCGAAINTADGAIVIEGGTVTATGGKLGAGIGGGDHQNGGTITINGGNVIATGGSYGAGIGGGSESNGGTITINGGIVIATGKDGGAGIGGGGGGNGGTITINGGTVTAISDNILFTVGGAGIGGGCRAGTTGGASGDILITGDAVVTATGGNGLTNFGSGAGIGSGGASSTVAAVNSITINTTGTVSATGGSSGGNGDGAAIGQGGYSSSGGAGISTFQITPATQTVAAGTAASFDSSFTVTGMGLLTLAFQWQVSINGGAFADIAATDGVGAATAGYTTSATTPSYIFRQYRCVVTATGGSFGSGSITLASPTAGLDVTYNEEDYGLIFKTDEGKFYLNVDLDYTVYPAFEYTGQPAAWSWNSATRTLTLDNFEWITSAATALREVYGSWTDPLTLYIKGTNRIESTYDKVSLSYDTSHGFFGDSYYLVIEGDEDGRLYFVGGPIQSHESIGINAYNITVNSGNLCAIGGDAGASSYGITVQTLEITGGCLQAVGGEATASFGLWAGQLTVSGGMFVASSDYTRWGHSQAIRLMAYGSLLGDLNMSGGEIYAFGGTMLQN